MSNFIQPLNIHSNNFISMPSDFFNNLSNLIEVKIDCNPFSLWQIPTYEVSESYEV